jgi:hypothetical protein
MTQALTAKHAEELRASSDAFWGGAKAPSATLTVKRSEPLLAPEDAARCDSLDARARRAEADADTAEAAAVAAVAEAKLTRKYARTARAAAVETRKLKMNEAEIVRAEAARDERRAKDAAEIAALEKKLAALKARAA